MLRARRNPPTGNHPVRAARSRSTNDVTSGGIETQRERQSADDGGCGVAAAAGEDAGGMPMSVASSSAVAPRSAVIDARSTTSCSNRAAVLDRFAQIEPHGAAQPVAVAREQWPIETQTMPLGGSNRGIEIERVERIAGRGLDQQQGGRRDRNDEHNGKRQPAKEIWKHR